MSLLDYKARFSKNQQQKMTKISTSSAEITWEQGHLWILRPSHTRYLIGRSRLRFCEEKAREKAPIYRWRAIEHGARHNRISSPALKPNDDLNFHCLWWQTCVKVRLEFKFGSFVIFTFCWAVNMARWCSNLVTSLCWWAVIGIYDFSHVRMMFLTSVCCVNISDSCSKLAVWLCTV